MAEIVLRLHSKSTIAISGIKTVILSGGGFFLIKILLLKSK